MDRILINMKVENILHDIYYNLDHPGVFTGAQTIFKYARKHGITLHQVKEWLKAQNTYTLHKPVKHKLTRRKTVVSGIDIQWQADLADLQSNYEIQ